MTDSTIHDVIRVEVNKPSRYEADERSEHPFSTQEIQITTRDRYGNEHTESLTLFSQQSFGWLTVDRCGSELA